MANNDTDVPRCRACGRYMELVEDGERVANYECCGLTKSRVRPEYRQKAKREIRNRREYYD